MKHAFCWKSAIAFFLFVSLASAANVVDVVFTSGNYSGCTSPAPVASYQTTDAFARIWFTVNNTNAGDVAAVQWLNPGGGVFSTSTFGALSGGGGWCFGATMNISGTAAANLPGTWTAQILWNNGELARRTFQILSPGGSSANLQVTAVDRPYYPPGSFTVLVSGSGFQNGARAHIDYTQSPNAHRLTTGGPVGTNYISDRQLAVPLSISDAGPYSISILNPNGASAGAFPFYVGPAGFNLPYASGETWKLSQGNNDTPDHSGKDSFAYDMTAGAGHCLVAMKAGMAYPFDNGAVQGSPGYGNWVTIDHGGGEYSHYGHMVTGKFAFTQPTYVQQGQALGVAGNSGHTLPPGGGYHVHVKVTGNSGTPMNNKITDQAVPFAFAPYYDTTMVGPVPGQKVSSDNPNDWPAYTSSNYSPLGACPASSNPTQAKLNITFNPNPVGNGFSQGCPANNYYFTLIGAEINGIGINLSTLSLDSWSWNVPVLGVPSRVEGKNSFQTGLSWCRSPGSSTFTITGTDDRGNHGSWSGVITFQ